MEQMHFYVVHYYSINDEDNEISNLNTIIFKREKPVVNASLLDFNNNTYKYVQLKDNRLLKLLNDRLIDYKKELLEKTDEIELKKMITKNMTICNNCITTIDNNLFHVYPTNDIDFFNELDEARYIVVDNTKCLVDNFGRPLENDVFEEAIDQTRDFYGWQYDGSYFYKKFKKLSDYNLKSIKDGKARSMMLEYALKLFSSNGHLKSSYFFNKNKKTKSRLAKRNELLKAFDDDYQFLMAYQEMQGNRLSLTNE